MFDLTISHLFNL